MNILMIAAGYFPHQIGGVQKHVRMIAEILARKGHFVRVMVPIESGAMMSMLTDGDVEIIYRELPRDPLLSLATLRRWFLPFGADREWTEWADVVQFHDFSFFLQWFVLAALLKKKPKAYVTFHGYEGYPLRSKTIFLRRVTNWLAQGSIGVGGFIEEFYGTKLDAVIYGGVMPSSTEDQPEFDAVWVGRLSPDTGFTHYYEAMKKIAETRAVKWLVIGDGPLSAMLDVSPANLSLEWRKSDPCAEDALSLGRVAFVSGYLAMLEAAARRVPVVAVYDNPVKKRYLECIPGGCKMFEFVADSGEIVDTTLRIWSNADEVRRKVDEAYEWSKRQTWEKVIDEYEKLWRNAARDTHLHRFQ